MRIRPLPYPASTYSTMLPSPSVSVRKPRSDRLEVTCPKALAWIQERIMFHTQPSPCEMKWKHDYSPGNHTRSDADHSLVCVKPELCSRMPVRYLICTKRKLYDDIMAEMEEAVRQHVPHQRQVRGYV